MTFLLRVACFGVGCALIWGASAVHAACLDRVRVNPGSVNSVTADALNTVRRLDPSFFGFNLEWVEFQLGLWDSQNQRVRPGVVQLLQAFPGAVYRFPGGTKSNHLNWADAVGPVVDRPNRQYVSWRPPLRAEFGPKEYLSFVRAVNGQAWYVANLYGDSVGPRPLTELSEDARTLAKHLLELSRDGLPPILRWELGNELDRGVHKWTPVQVAKAGNEVAAAIRSVDQSARFVHLQQEYAAMATAGYTVKRYNRELREGLRLLDAELALHTYYDGVPENPSVGFFLKRLCDVVDDAHATGGTGRLWITEHARVPNGFWPGAPKALWPETANLAAASSVADMLIATAQIPEVLGAFAHSLVAAGSPWPMMHTHPDGRVDPSATLLAMQILRQTMKPNVIATRQSSHGRGSQEALYTIRSAVLANDDRSEFTLWSVNRSDQQQELSLHIANSHTPLRFSGSMLLWSKESTVGNHTAFRALKTESDMHKVSASGRDTWRVVLPPNSINALVFR